MFKWPFHHRLGYPMLDLGSVKGHWSFDALTLPHRCKGWTSGPIQLPLVIYYQDTLVNKLLQVAPWKRTAMQALGYRQSTMTCFGQADGLHSSFAILANPSQKSHIRRLCVERPIKCLLDEVACRCIFRVPSAEGRPRLLRQPFGSVRKVKVGV